MEAAIHQLPAPEDRCHLNGLALAGGSPKFVTSLAQTDVKEGWRPIKATSGCLIDMASQEAVVSGLAMPHSPRVHEGRIWLLDSGRGRLVVADPARGTVETVAELPGYSRGLAFLGRLAFIGLSKVRESNSDVEGIPIAAQREQLKCGVAVVDWTCGREVGFLEFKSGIEEIFDVQVLPGVRTPLIAGPNPHIDGRSVWVVP